MIFFHVPKTAGVSVSKAIYGRPLGHFCANDVRKTMPSTFSSAFTFGISRHPVNRLYSAYRFSRIGHTSEMGIRDPDKYQIDEFKTFESFVSNWLLFQDLSKLDGVFRPQHFYLCQDRQIIVDRVFKFEKIEEIETILSSVLEKNIRLSRSNISPIEEEKIIDQKTIEIIEEMYYLDFEIFGYSSRINA